MGKGISASHIDAGEYSVTLELDTSGIDDEITRLDENISDIDSQLAGMEEGLDKEVLRLRKTALQKRKEYLQDPGNVPENPTENVWCADLTEDLSGNVGIIEVAGVRGKGFNIQPGYDGNAVYDAVRDGKIKPAAATPSPETYFNWGIQGGWQKWTPGFRYGTISNLDRDADTCTVTFDAETNDDTGLDINQTTSLSDVAIEYMDCNSAAFEDGDEVVVEFQENDWNSPQVIGFKSEPKGCVWEPWGSTLCANNTWGSCSLLSGMSLSDGILSVSKAGDATVYSLVCETPEIDASKQTFAFKCSGSGGGSDAYMMFRLHGSQDCNLGYKRYINIYLLYMGYTPPHPHSADCIQDYFMGFSDEEQEFDLGATFISGQILSKVEIRYWVPIGSVSFDLDYLNFR